jgi:hypothetical protein
LQTFTAIENISMSNKKPNCGKVEIPPLETTSPKKVKWANHRHLTI